jgi:hypothetical protein
MGYLFFFVAARASHRAANRGFVSREARECLWLLFLGFATQVYLVASLWGEQLYLGSAFGFRQLTECGVVLAPGLAVLLQRAHGFRFRLVCLAGGILVVWNLVLMSQYRYGWIPADAGAEPSELLANTLRLVLRKRWLLLPQVALAPVLLALAWTMPLQRPVAVAKQTLTLSEISG